MTYAERKALLLGKGPDSRVAANIALDKILIRVFELRNCYV